MFTNKLDNLDEMYKFPPTYKLHKMIQDERDNLNRSISKEMKSVIKNIARKKNPGSDDFKSEFQQTFREDLMPVLLKLFQKIEEDYFQTHFMRTELP